MSLQQVMMIFFSGAEKEPPLGFAEKPRLEFIEGDGQYMFTDPPDSILSQGLHIICEVYDTFFDRS